MLRLSVPRGKNVSLILAFCCLVSFAVAARAQAEGTAGQTTRGAKKVTLKAEWIPLHQLLEKIAVASGMSLTTDLNDAASATPMAIYVKDVPFSDVADALASSLSQRRAAWRWTEAGDKEGTTISPETMKPGVTYLLRCSVAARNYAAHARARILDDLATQAQVAASDAENASVANVATSDNPAVNNLPSLDAASRNAPPKIEESAARRGVSAFFAHLDAAQRDRVLQGIPVEGRLDRIDPAQAAAIEAYARQRDDAQQQEWAAKGPGNPDMFGPGGSTHVFAGAALRRDGRSITPKLDIYSGIVVQHTQGGYSSQFPLLSVGAKTLKSRWRDILIHEWTPSETDADATLTIPRTPDSAPAPEMLVTPPPAVYDFTEDLDGKPGPIKDDLTESLSRLNKATDIPIIARLSLPGGPQTGLEMPGGKKTLGGFRADLLATLTTATRWHRKILLANPLNAIWETAPEYLCPPTFLAALRQEREKDALGCLSFDTICAASRLSPEALRSLSQEFPVMEELIRWRPLLSFLAKDARLRRQIQQEPGIAPENNLALWRAYQESGREPGTSHFIEDIMQEESRPNKTPASNVSPDEAKRYLLIRIADQSEATATARVRGVPPGKGPRRVIVFTTITNFGGGSTGASSSWLTQTPAATSAPTKGNKW